jgi:hypothetical protein
VSLPLLSKIGSETAIVPDSPSVILVASAIEMCPLQPDEILTSASRQEFPTMKSKVSSTTNPSELVSAENSVI